VQKQHAVQALYLRLCLKYSPCFLPAVTFRSPQSQTPDKPKLSNVCGSYSTWESPAKRPLNQAKSQVLYKTSNQAPFKENCMVRRQQCHLAPSITFRKQVRSFSGVCSSAFLHHTIQTTEAWLLEFTGP
jgi:hypothetical protein